MAEEQTPAVADPTPPAAPPAEPRKYAGKYDSVEAMEQGYKELESKLGQPAPAAPATPPAPADPPAAPAVDPTALSLAPLPAVAEAQNIEDIMQRAGVTSEDVAAEWQQNGRLSEDQYNKFQNLGFPKIAVDEVIRGQVAQAEVARIGMEQSVSAAQQLAGGEDQLKNLLAYGATALTPDQQVSINTRLQDPRQVESVVRELRDMHRDSVGASETRQHGGGEAPASASGAGCQSAQEFGELIRQIESQGFQPTPEQRAKMANTPAEIIQARTS